MNETPELSYEVCVEAARVAYLHAANATDRILKSELSTVAALWTEIARRTSTEHRPTTTDQAAMIPKLVRGSR